MQYYVKIHISTISIQGYLEAKDLTNLESAYKSKSEEICTICLAENQYDSDRTNISVSPSQIIAIESKFVR